MFDWFVCVLVWLFICIGFCYFAVVVWFVLFSYLLVKFGRLFVCCGFVLCFDLLCLGFLRMLCWLVRLNCC